MERLVKSVMSDVRARSRRLSAIWWMECGRCNPQAGEIDRDGGNTDRRPLKPPVELGACDCPPCESWPAIGDQGDDQAACSRASISNRAWLVSVLGISTVTLSWT